MPKYVVIALSNFSFVIIYLLTEVEELNDDFPKDGSNTSLKIRFDCYITTLLGLNCNLSFYSFGRCCYLSDGYYPWILRRSRAPRYVDLCKSL